MARKDGEQLTPAKRQQKKAYQDLGYGPPAHPPFVPKRAAPKKSLIFLDDLKQHVADQEKARAAEQDEAVGVLESGEDEEAPMEPKKGYRLGPHNIKSRIGEVLGSRLDDALNPGSKKYVLWTGGFDSTALIIKHLNDRDVSEIQPIYMTHSQGYVKCELEQAAQQRIRDYYGTGVRRSKLLPTILWDYAQLSQLPAFKALNDTLEELATACGLSYQYSALRFCMMATGWNPDVNLSSVRSIQAKSNPTENRPLEVGLVRNDEAAERYTMSEARCSSFKCSGTDGDPVKTFFKGFEFPFITRLKTEIWEESSPADQAALRMTFSCERADEGKRSCSERKVAFWSRCTPCKHRLGVLEQAS